MSQEVTVLGDLSGTGKAGNTHSHTLHILRHPETRLTWRVLQP